MSAMTVGGSFPDPQLPSPARQGGMAVHRSTHPWTRALVTLIGWSMLAFGGATSSTAAGPGVATMDVGGTHACAVRTDGTVWCWGFNFDGRLGDGTTGDPVTHMRTTPVRVLRGSGALRDVIKVTAGGYHTCALRKGSDVLCWGDNSYGQLGDGQVGSSAFRTKAVRVRRGSGFLTGVRHISGGDSHTCALMSDGGVLCWGDGSDGQLGDGRSGMGHLRTRAVRVRHGSGYLRGVKAIAAGFDHTCALKRDGSVWCWGQGELGELGDGRSGYPYHRSTPVRVRRGSGYLTRVVGIAAVGAHTCARRTDGTAWCWGHDVHGQLGDGTLGAGVSHIRVRPVQVRRGSGMLTHVTAISAGQLHSCARRSDGSAWCWGWDSHGQLGDGTTGDPTDHRRLRAVRVVRAAGPFTHVLKLDGGVQHTCALRTDHTVWCWGINEYGQLGQGFADAGPHPYPLRVTFP